MSCSPVGRETEPISSPAPSREAPSPASTRQPRWPHPVSCVSTPRRTPAWALHPITGPLAGFVENYVPLRDAAVRFHGQAVAMVVAETPEQARDAAARITATYDIRPPRTSIADEPHVPAGPTISGSPGSLNILAPGVASLDAALAASDIVVYDHPALGGRTARTHQVPDMPAYFRACGPDRREGLGAGCGESVHETVDGRVGGHRAEHVRLGPQLTGPSASPIGAGQRHSPLI